MGRKLLEGLAFKGCQRANIMTLALRSAPLTRLGCYRERYEKKEDMQAYQNRIIATKSQDAQWADAQFCQSRPNSGKDHQYGHCQSL
jgi:hypothetical protein